MAFVNLTWPLPVFVLHQHRQLRDIHRDPPRIVFRAAERRAGSSSE